MRKKQLADLTVGISCLGNMAGLKCCLAALAAGRTMPANLNIRLESDIPGINDYYFEQLLCVFRFYGVAVNLQLRHAHGIHTTREAQVQACQTKWLVLLDDDVMPDGALLQVYSFLIETVSEGVVMIQGTKPDLNNRRGYADFLLEPVAYPKNLTKDGNFNHPLIDEHVGITYAEMGTRFCDPGNMALNVELYHEHGLAFRLFDIMVKRAGGEDTTFAMQCVSKGLKRLWTPAALVWHLEKELSQTRLTEHAYRKEALLRAGEQAGLFNERLTHKVFEESILAWEKLDRDTDPS